MPVAAAAVEIVERKGTGHPDSICDALAETASLALCRLYRERFGVILHHNVDKALLLGGRAEPDFGGGRVIRPIEIFLAGRATRHFEGVALPVEDSVEEACRAWLRDHLTALDADRHIKLHIRLRPASEELVSLFPSRLGTDPILANDTSCGVGFAPLTPLERAVYAVERGLNGRTMKAAHPEIGEDIKVMGVRTDRDARFTVALAFVGAHLGNARDYLLKKSSICELSAPASVGWPEINESAPTRPAPTLSTPSAREKTPPAQPAAAGPGGPDRRRQAGHRAAAPPIPAPTAPSARLGQRAAGAAASNKQKPR